MTLHGYHVRRDAYPDWVQGQAFHSHFIPLVLVIITPCSPNVQDPCLIVPLDVQVSLDGARRATLLA